MTIFFTGCTHFDHDNIIKLAGRPFADVDEMNEELVRRWNAVVGPQDMVYHLGDVAWNRSGIKFLKRLNGRIIVIPGNRDSAFDLSRYYTESQGRILIGELMEEFDRFVICHYPIEDWNHRWKGSIHLHCHTHAKELRNPNIPYIQESFMIMDEEYDSEGVRDVLPPRYPPDLKCNRFNVGVDATAFAPISLEEILEESRK